ncbi:MAG: hypothetical protein ACTSP3_12875 [Candidatus Heimdallarchaeaceae archaeon]
MSYLIDEIREIYKDRIDPKENRWAAFRNLQRILESKNFDTKDLQLLGAIILDIIEKHGGSKEEVFRALYKGYKL